MQTRRIGGFGGRPVEQFSLVSDTGVAVDILNWGVVVRDWRVPVPGGMRSVVLGYPDFGPYPEHSPYFGALIGRVANRIRGARLDLHGTTHHLVANWNGHSLHSGPDSFATRIWEAEPDSAGNAVRFTLVSPDGEGGFPGTVRVAATYSLSGNRLRLDIAAEADRDTPLNIVQHQYFNLGTGNDVLDHRVRIAASHYTPSDDSLMPIGPILPVDGTQWDFRAPRTMRDASGAPLAYDGNLVLDADRGETPAAEVVGPDGLLRLRLYTDRPGLQFYNGVWTDAAAPGQRAFGKYSAFCLEDQDFPDAVHHPHFPSIIHGPGRPYRHVSEIEIG